MEWYVTLRTPDFPSSTIRCFIRTGFNGSGAIASVTTIPTSEKPFELVHSDSERGAFLKMLEKLRAAYPDYVWVLPLDD